MTSTNTPQGEGILTLVPDALVALCNPYSLEGHVSTHPRGSAGFASMNCYVLIEENSALLIDTGLAIHQEVILSQLETILINRQRLSILPFRFGEFSALCNARPIADRFELDCVYGRGMGEPDQWLDFRPGFSSAGGGLTGVPGRSLLIGTDIEIGAQGNRSLELLLPPIRLLPGLWAYDKSTRTLFTSDFFTWFWSGSEDGPWRVGGAGGSASSAHIRDFLVRNRYWWLPGARTDRLRKDFANVFDNYRIDRIAPGYGAIIEGPAAVRDAYLTVDSVLSDLAREESIGVMSGIDL